MDRALAVTLVICAVLCAGAPTAEAQVYRWVDKDGKVHYSDKKPKDAAAKEMAIQSQASDPEAAEKTMAELRAQNEGLDQTDAQRKQAAADKEKADQQRAAQCKAAQSEAQLLRSVNRYFTVDHKGDRVYDTDAQLAARRSKADARVAQLCG
jgi:hypothetical protein